ncbi:protease HtpX [Candidatus Gracilibacteria bacterium]|nr:protease HtpX [Candidatus Gracilibacteria bacterium]MCF7819350.1 protease HtpX [Candidatus Gracilibacteria bacterium]
MRFIKRIVLFVLVNFAILIVLGIVMSVFGVQPYLTSYGLNLKSLLIFAAIIGFAGSFLSLFLSKVMARWMMKVRIIKSPSNNEESLLVEVIRSIAKKLEIKTPEVGIYPSAEVNAFATGWSQNHSMVAVSEGLLREMDRDEIEGVLAHEMAHIANGDMVTMALLQGVLNTFVIFFARVAAFLLQRLISDREEVGGISYWITSILFEIVFAVLATIVIAWFSRKREFRADHGGAEFVGKAKMIAGLQRLQELTARVDTRQKSLATLKISDKPSKMGLLFSTHPPLSDRIEALEKASLS